MKKHLMFMFFFSMLILHTVSCTRQKPEVESTIIPVATIPIGADVYVDGTYVGKSPLTCTVKRNSDHLILLSKEGYKAEVVHLVRIWNHSKQMQSALKRGVDTTLVTSDYTHGLGSVPRSLDEDEITCKWYDFIPSVVNITLNKEALITESDRK